jgi:hypothetical protein
MKLIKIVVKNFIKTQKGFYNIFKIELNGFKGSSEVSLGNNIRSFLLKKNVCLFCS